MTPITQREKVLFEYYSSISWGFKKGEGVIYGIEQFLTDLIVQDCSKFLSKLFFSWGSIFKRFALDTA